MADLGLVADLFKAVPEMLEKVWFRNIIVTKLTACVGWTHCYSRFVVICTSNLSIVI